MRQHLILFYMLSCIYLVCFCVVLDIYIYAYISVFISILFFCTFLSYINLINFNCSPKILKQLKLTLKLVMSYLMDPDEFVTCPYDSNHRVQIHRLQMHILKCKKV